VIGFLTVLLLVSLELSKIVEELKTLSKLLTKQASFQKSFL